MPAAATAAGLWLSFRHGLAQDTFRGAPFQFLGKISYSIYLMHVPVLMIGLAAWNRLAGRSIAADAAGLVLAIVGVIAVSYIFWWLIERPAHRWSQALFAANRPREVRA